MIPKIDYTNKILCCRKKIRCDLDSIAIMYIKLVTLPPASDGFQTIGSRCRHACAGALGGVLGAAHLRRKKCQSHHLARDQSRWLGAENVECMTNRGRPARRSFSNVDPLLSLPGHGFLVRSQVPLAVLGKLPNPRSFGVRGSCSPADGNCPGTCEAVCPALEIHLQDNFNSRRLTLAASAFPRVLVLGLAGLGQSFSPDVGIVT
ncbi:uncharacterized protein BDZ83DRAFT_420166 [Colletotrichum acutatum]|uniref:Uncharacterized protein n=1 Tax=Glomerella acutata TaxID=27357 RepID=A0AAD8XCB4_GLOAC|nr:uncharacterized protein BDZ83DRAFT_420166 [Colletotrichum acutatum]KAK1722474.1 hypothetical protein BDZ83DRAFT_420166 [Colletotrichum acutatum]